MFAQANRLGVLVDGLVPYSKKRHYFAVPIIKTIGTFYA